MAIVPRRESAPENQPTRNRKPPPDFPPIGTIDPPTPGRCTPNETYTAAELDQIVQDLTSTWTPDWPNPAEALGSVLTSAAGSWVVHLPVPGGCHHLQDGTRGEPTAADRLLAAARHGGDGDGDGDEVYQRAGLLPNVSTHQYFCASGPARWAAEHTGTWTRPGWAAPGPRRRVRTPSMALVGRVSPMTTARTPREEGLIQAGLLRLSDPSPARTVWRDPFVVDWAIQVHGYVIGFYRHTPDALLLRDGELVVADVATPNRPSPHALEHLMTLVSRGLGATYVLTT